MIDKNTVGFYPPTKNKDFLLYSIPRSASTLTWQIANELLPGKVYASHQVVTKHAEYIDSVLKRYVEEGRTGTEFRNWIDNFYLTNVFSDEVPVIISVRCPFDCAYSMALAKEKQMLDDPNAHRSIDLPGMFFEKFVTSLYVYRSMMISGRQTLILRYENHAGKEGLLTRIEKIAKFMNVEASNKKIQEIAEKFSIEKNLERSKKFKHFGEYDKETLIHGDHINHRSKGQSGFGLVGCGFQTVKELCAQHGGILTFFGYNYNIPDKTT